MVDLEIGETNHKRHDSLNSSLTENTIVKQPTNINENNGLMHFNILLITYILGWMELLN